MPPSLTHVIPTLTPDRFRRARERFTDALYAKMAKARWEEARVALQSPVYEHADANVQAGELQDRGFAYMTQDGIAAFLRDLEHEDHQRAEIDDGTSVAILLFEGAVQNMAANARNGDLEDAESMLEGFAGELAGHAANPYAKALLARCHRVLGSFYRGSEYIQQVPPERMGKFLAHFSRAEDLIAGLDPVTLDSPFIASLRHSLLEASSDAGATLQPWYQDWFDLAPRNRHVHERQALYLMPVWMGSDFEEFETAARWAALRHPDQIGTAPYFDFMTNHHGCFPNWATDMDLALFLSAIEDHCRFRPNQSIFNEMANVLTMLALSTNQEADDPRASGAIAAEALNLLLRTRLSEVHIDKWKSPTYLFAGLALCFDDELSAGKSIVLGAESRPALNA